MSDHSPRLDQLTAALVRMQTELTAIKTDAIAWVGPQGASDSYRYATLDCVWAGVRQALTANGFAISQTCEPGEAGEMRLTTWLLHTSGQWLCGTASLPVTWRSPRGYGSAMTHARRYGLAAIVGICVEHDDDAAAAVEPPHHRRDHVELAGLPDELPLEVDTRVAEHQAEKELGHARAAHNKHRVSPVIHGRNGDQPSQ